MAKRAVEQSDNGSGATGRQIVASETLDTSLAATLLGLSVVSLLFAKHAPEPYMDEPFHVQQTQQYCNGNFQEWDPKITTFPGLYILGASAGTATWKLLSVLTSRPQVLCGTQSLRSVNIALALIVLLLSYSLYRKIHKTVSHSAALRMGFVVLLLPTNFFYTFLYYTDMGSLAAVLAAFLASLASRYKVAGVAASIAVLFRQTNAVWVAFITVDAALRTLSSNPILEAPKAQYGLSQQVVATVRLSIANFRLLLRRLWPLISVPVAFAVFVIWNGGIVVGDKSNHTPKLHLMQPLYFALFSTLALNQVHCVPSRILEGSHLAAQALRRKPKLAVKSAIMLFVLTYYTVRSFTLAHPFLLADNRHYTFYLWKDIIAAYPMAKFCLVPLYMYAMWTLRYSLRAAGRLEIWILAFVFAVVLTLAPAWLIEFRYYTVPCTLVMLFSEPPTNQQLLRTIVLFCTVNTAVVYVFLFRPFKWPDGSTARFMW